MAAVRPEQPVPRITVSRTEFSMALIGFMAFDMDSGLFPRLLPVDAPGGFGSGAEPADVRAESRAQPQRAAIPRHDLRSAAENAVIRALVGLLAAGEPGGALAQPL